jgi:uncharacterized protein (TIGR00369 family)
MRDHDGYELQCMQMLDETIVYGSQEMGDIVKGPLLSLEELELLLWAEFPQMMNPEGGLSIEAVSFGACRLRQAFRERFLRPGGTVSGATIIALGDFAVYVAILASIGWLPLAVTTSLTVNFLRKPPPQRDLIAECKLLKLGRRLAVGEVVVRGEGEEEAAAHITATYSIPPQT